MKLLAESIQSPCVELHDPRQGLGHQTLPDLSMHEEATTKRDSLTQHLNGACTSSPELQQDSEFLGGTVLSLNNVDFKDPAELSGP